MTLSGEFDITTASRIGQAAAPLLGGAGPTPQPSTVEIDLSAVTFMDSVALTSLADTTEALLEAGYHVILVRPGRSLSRLLALAHRDGWLPLHLTIPHLTLTAAL